jgi:aminopeptidase N
MPDIVLDFRDQDADGKITNGKIESVTVNGTLTDDFRQINGHIVFGGKNFKTGENKITLDFASKIAAANRPLVRFVDSSDGGEYVYSLFTPADASLAFPCFDQPDLKGRFSLEITAPESWTAISNAQILESKKIGEDLRRTLFAETKPLSTYLSRSRRAIFEKLKTKTQSFRLAFSFAAPSLKMSERSRTNFSASRTTECGE